VRECFASSGNGGSAVTVKLTTGDSPATASIKSVSSTYFGGRAAVRPETAKDAGSGY
jgi:hypothetical protein